MKRTAIIAAVVGILICFTGCSSYDNPVKAPFDSQDCVEMAQEDVLSQLKDAGFTNVETKETETTEEDKAGKVIGVTIDGKENYKKKDVFEADAPVEVDVYVQEEPVAEEQTAEELEVYLETTAQGEAGNVVFSIRTNLPDGTVISIELDNDTTLDMTQQEVTVKQGRAVSQAFEIATDAMEDTYYFSALMLPGSEQPEKVNAIVGQNGENLSGELVKEYVDNYYCIAAYYNYDAKNNRVSVYQEKEETESPKSASSVVTTAESPEQVEDTLREVLSGFGDNCAITLEGYLYTVNVWQDGLANTALQAILGDKAGTESWNSIVKTTEEASKNLQIIVDANGGESYMVQLNILNDQNTDNILLTAVWGTTTYNCVTAQQ